MEYNEIQKIRICSNYQKFISKYFKTAEDLIDNFSFISLLEFDENQINDIVCLMSTYILDKKRNKKAKASVLLYRIIRDYSYKKLSEKSTDLIFQVFQNRIFIKNNYRWKISAILKDEQIKWLVDNCNDDELILNRILRYPKESKIIEEWCLDKIDDNSYVKNRISEYIAKCLTFNRFNSFLNKFGVLVMSWAIFYSNSKDVENMLFLLLDKNKSCIDISKVALRLNLNSIIEKQHSLLMK